MGNFILHSDYKPAGDQPQAIDRLVKEIQQGTKEQILLGVTGSGKTFTMANVIARVNKPTLVLAHNKILAAQLCSEFREFFPDRHIFFLPEAIETELYIDNKKLQDRHIDFLQYGRCSTIIDAESLPDTINVVSSRDEKRGIKTRHDLIDALSNSKLTIALTRQDNQPEIAEGIDTLTQRYWECMLSGVILLGRAPQELIDIIGYDPTIPIDMNNINQQIQSILKDVTSYQELVDKNREIAMRLGDWKLRVIDIKNKLLYLGYSL